MGSKTTSNNLIPHNHHKLKGINWERERERERERESIERRTYSNLGPYLPWNTRYMLLDVPITIHCTNSVDIWVHVFCNVRGVY